MNRLLGPSGVVALLASEVILAASCYVIALILVVRMDPMVFLLHNKGLLRVGVVVGTLVTGFYFQDLYDDLRVRSRVELARQVSLVFGIAFILQALLNYVSRELVLPRWVMFTGSAFAVAAILGWRILYSRFLESAIHAERVLFLGISRLAREIESRLQEKPQFGMLGIGYVGDEEDNDCGVSPENILGPLSDFRRIAQEARPDRIIVAMPERRQRLPQSDLLDLKFSGVIIQDAPSAYETTFERVCVRELRPSELIFSPALGPQPMVLFLKSIYSTVLAAAVIVLAAPLLLTVALLVKLTSRGPVLYRQERVGLRGKRFVILKFRSMYTDAEAKTGAVWAMNDDPRVTWVGKWLRRYRLDEWPQMVNVLKGDMSIVGPRPERPEFVDQLAEQVPFYRQRLNVKPGLTGWAQINHKYGDTLDDAVTKLEYDLYYIRHLTLTLDGYIMFHTLKVILLGRGAQ
ncbi:MAG: sugar transferase [Bryobacteraceae bacterium]|nr:sugar transferase [Bryobacteraceae bacterium]